MQWYQMQYFTSKRIRLNGFYSHLVKFEFVDSPLNYLFGFGLFSECAVDNKADILTVF